MDEGAKSVNFVSVVVRNFPGMPARNKLIILLFLISFVQNQLACCLKSSSMQMELNRMIFYYYIKHL